jgi:Fe-S-cluster containining protein
MFDCSKVCPKKCKADCCGYVPIPEDLWEKHKAKAQREYKEIPWDDTHVLPLTEDLNCPFLDINYKCVIYSDRPWLCQVFGTKEIQGLKCPYLKTDGSKRGKEERKRLITQNLGNLQRIADRISKAIEMKNQGKSDLEINEVVKKI